MRIFAALVALAVASTCWADDDPLWREVTSNLASDWAACASFYLLTADGFESAQQQEAFDRSMSLALHALQMAAALSNEKRALAETELHRKLMLNEIDNDLANFAVLSNQHLLPCTQLFENPEARTKYWIEHFSAEE
jgi:hypothetical protein